MAQIKTYRNTHSDVLKVGELEILPGELIPEAEKWDEQILRSHLKINRLEVVYIDQETFDQELAERNERLDYYPDAEEELTESETEVIEPEKQPKKVAVRRKRGQANAGNKLEEQNV